MANGTCSTESCDRPIMCRGLCGLHYGRARQRGDIAIRPRRPPLTDINVEARTVTCPIHGPGSRLRVRKRKGLQTTYACRICDRVGRGTRRRPTALVRTLHKYRLSPAEYQIMTESQAGRCLICRETPERLVVDHDHETKKVRGLLCHRCNVALGWMNDSPENLVRAARYLRRHVA